MPQLRGRGRAFVAAALFAVAALCVAPVAVDALHEDQLGSFDWHTEYLGRVAHAAFAGSKTKQRAFVASEEGAIGALDAKTGDIGAFARPRASGSPTETSARGGSAGSFSFLP